MVNIFVYYPIVNFILKLVTQARQLKVELSPGAEKIIHGYYMASRRVRTQTHSVKISVASIRLL